MLKYRRLMTTDELDKYLSLAETPAKQKKYIESLKQELFYESEDRGNRSISESIGDDGGNTRVQSRSTKRRSKD